jgi:hypothetical protein
VCGVPPGAVGSGHSGRGEGSTPTEPRTEADGPQHSLSRQAWDDTAVARPLTAPVRQRERDIVKTLAFVIGLYILAVGAIGICTPSGLIWIAQRFTTPVDWYALAAVRVAVGGLLVVVAKASRAPTALRVVACIPLVAALATPFVGVERARATIEWWSLQGSGVVRLSAIPLLALGGFITYVCAPARRAAEPL